MTLANKLTLFRMGLAGLVVLGLLIPSPSWHLGAFVLFALAAVTDAVDGYIARASGAISSFGKVADPIADKLLVLGALIALARHPELDIPLWGVFLIVARELLIAGLRVLAAVQGKLIPAQRWGKWSMEIQSVSVLLIIAVLVTLERFPSVPPLVKLLPYYLTLVCVAGAVGSAVLYFMASRRMLEKSWG